MTIGQTMLKYGIKAAGAAGLGICLYDAHKQGRYRSQIESRKGNIQAGIDWFDNTRNVNTPSQFNANVKDGLFNFEIQNNFRAFINSGIGYVKGACEMMFNDLLPIGLSVAAIATKGKTSSKVAAGALALYSTYAFAKNILGIGVSNENGKI
jgi:hypothetical protein